MICFQFSNKPVLEGTSIIGTSIYVPRGYSAVLNSATAIGASGDFAPYIELLRYGDYYRPTTTNQNLAGYMIQGYITIT